MIKIEAALVIFIFPIVVVIAAIVGTYLLKNWLLMPFFTFLLFLVLTFTVFNSSFFIWAVTYGVLAAVGSFFTTYVIRRRQNN